MIAEVIEMEEVARFYFQELFTTNGIGDTNHILKGVKRCILDESNLVLMKRYIVDEIVVALKGMEPTKASGNDNFLALFKGAK